LRKLGVATEVYVCGGKKSRGISVDFYGEATKNANNSANIYPFDLIRKWEHDTIYILY